MSATRGVRVQCPSCEETVIVSPRSRWRCPRCTLAFCPICHTSLIDGCEHVVASWAGDFGWNYDPFEKVRLPEVPDHVVGREVPQELWAEVFGEDAAMMEEVYTSYGELVSVPELAYQWPLFQVLLERAKSSVQQSAWEVDGRYTSTHGTDIFAPEPAAVLEAVDGQMAPLRAGFERLAAALLAEESLP